MCQKKLCYELAQYFIFHKKISEPFCFLKLNDLRGSLDRKDEILGGKVQSMAWMSWSQRIFKTFAELCCAFCAFLSSGVSYPHSLRQGSGIGQGSAVLRAMSSMWERVLQKDRMHKIGDVEWDWECCKSKKSEAGMSRRNGRLPRVFGETRRDDRYPARCNMGL